MAEQTYEVRTVGVDYICDECRTGKMEPTGIMLPTYPPRWRHKCSHCNETADLSQQYPTVRYERARLSFQLGTEQYAISGMRNEPLTFPYWNVIDPKWRALAKNEDGDWYLYESKPYVQGKGKFWDHPKPVMYFSGVNMPIELCECDWKDSLIERPEGE